MLVVQVLVQWTALIVQHFRLVIGVQVTVFSRGLKIEIILLHIRLDYLQEFLPLQGA